MTIDELLEHLEGAGVTVVDEQLVDIALGEAGLSRDTIIVPGLRDSDLVFAVRLATEPRFTPAQTRRLRKLLMKLYVR